MNTIKTAMLLAAMTGIFLAVGYMIAGPGGMAIAFVLALAMNAFSYWNADKVVLKMHGAREVDATTAPVFYNLVGELARRADLPMPRVYVMDNAQPNAFATGRDPDHAAVAATTGLLKLMSREEIAAVMAHELAHVRNRDTLIMTVTATIAGAIGMLASFAFWFGGRGNNNPLGIVGVLVAAIVAPIAAMMVQMAVSRVREYKADRIGAEICGRPDWLASALAKLDQAARGTVNERAEANPATAHMFIVNPLSGRRMDNLFSTHPATANRIAALREMAPPGGPAPTARAASSAPGMAGPWGAGPGSVPTAGTRRGPWG